MQIIGYKWKNGDSWSPKLITIEDDRIRFHDLFDKDISMKIGGLYCIGYFTNGKRSPCPTNEKLEKGTVCKACEEKDYYHKCLGCSGECINEKHRETCKDTTFYTYLTTFGPLLKVGISQEHRFFERMIEQGAELGIKFGRIKDGKEARQLEQRIKRLLLCEDRVYGDTKERHMFGDPNAVMLKLRNALETIQKFGMSSINTEIYDFRKYYKLNNVTKQPKPIIINTGTVIEGTVIAAKGNLLILKKGDDFYTINVHRLVARAVLSFSII
ncbi:MAG: DUF2797 domain-containing protein [Candidatus Aenigmarchaeota archaeon]|nr:DUF2797 domain-containing protein [Candidatus Aenigmarchaeota archaeon]